MKIIYIENEIKSIAIEDVEIERDCIYWFHMSPEELRRINTRYFGFQEDSIDECENLRQFAKVDFYDKYTFLVLNALRYENGTVYPDEFNIFITKDIVVTVSKENVKIIDQLHQVLIGESGTFVIKDKCPARLLYCILDKLVQSDYEIINKLENSADSLEINIIKKPDQQFLTALLHLRHQVHTLRRCITPLRYIGDNLLCNDNSIIDKEQVKYLKQINGKIDKLLFSMESLVQYIVLVREAFETEMANKTNDFMKIFTAVSLFFGSLTLMVDLFGMFFVYPQYNLKYGYLGMLSLVLSISMALFIYFKKKRWF